MGTNVLNDTEDEEARKDGSRPEGCIPDATEGVRKRRRRSRLNEANTTISTAA